MWRKQLDVCQKIRSSITLNYYSSSRVVDRLVREVRKLYPLLPKHLQAFGDFLKADLVGLFEKTPPGMINAFSYGHLCRDLDCLSVVSWRGTKRVFISHSSKDKIIVDAFVDKILRLGIGISPEEIFCTSLEDLRIRNGEDIRRHIHENILGCEYAFLLISDNYFKSAICQNELGAVWVSDAKVKIYTFPNVEIPKAIGWLCEPQVAESLSDEHALDRLFEEMKNDFSLSTSLTTFSKQRTAFLALLDKKKKSFSLDNFF